MGFKFLVLFNLRLDSGKQGWGVVGRTLTTGWLVVKGDKGVQGAM